MHAGIPLCKIDDLHELFERTGIKGVSLTASTHLRAYIPLLEQFENDTLRSEIKDESVCLIYDGMTRLGECTAVLFRFCKKNFEIKQRLIALRTVRKHMNGDNLGPFLIDLLGQMGIRSASVMCMARDSCSTNAKAERNIKPILPYDVCVSHTHYHIVRSMWTCRSSKNS